MPDCISSDTTFYICVGEDLQRQEQLCNFLQCYPFFLGPNIFRELPESLQLQKEFQNSVNKIDGNFFELLKPFFGRDKKHETDGEYEAIGIACNLERKKVLRFLILDEKRARNFVNTHFTVLVPKMIRSLGFLKIICCDDKRIKREIVIEILESLVQDIKRNESKSGPYMRRPCGMTINNYKNIVVPLLNQVRSWDN